MSCLAKNLWRMSRVELNNLAKNKYSDDEIQVWIAQNGHIQARYYLAENESLCQEAIDILLQGRSTMAKATMVASFLIQDEDTIRDIYNACKSRLKHWRITHLFVRTWGRGLVKSTPSDVLEDIYSRYKERLSRTGGGLYSYYSTALPMNIAEHTNCSLKLAIQLSQHSDVKVAAAGRDALVAISRRGDDSKS